MSVKKENLAVSLKHRVNHQFKQSRLKEEVNFK